jgi:hypothetical protein
MCGIFGVVKKQYWIEDGDFSSNSWPTNYSKISTEDDTALKTMLYATTLRGTDATGVALIHHGSSPSVLVNKAPVNGIDFSRLSDWGDAENLLLHDNIGIIGHCRAGTVGGQGTRLAHPFNNSAIVGVHNGTLKTWKHLGSPTDASDSMALYSELNNCSNYIEVLADIDGAYALVWYDKTVNRYFFARNSDRPLSYIKTDQFVMFASEWQTLNFAVTRSSSFKELEDRPGYKFMEFTKHVLYELDPKTMTFTEHKYEPVQKTKYIQPSPTQKWTESKKARDAELSHSAKLKAAAEKLTGLVVGKAVNLIPCGYKEYPNDGRGKQLGYGSVYGYIVTGEKRHYWIVYGLKQAKQFYEDYYKNFPNSISGLCGNISYVSAVLITDDKHQKPTMIEELKDPLTGQRIFPEQLCYENKDHYVVHSIKADTLVYDAVSETVH